MSAATATASDNERLGLNPSHTRTITRSPGNRKTSNKPTKKVNLQASSKMDLDTFNAFMTETTRKGTQIRVSSAYKPIHQVNLSFNLNAPKPTGKKQSSKMKKSTSKYFEGRKSLLGNPTNDSQSSTQGQVMGNVDSVLSIESHNHVKQKMQALTSKSAQRYASTSSVKRASGLGSHSGKRLSSQDRAMFSSESRRHIRHIGETLSGRGSERQSQQDRFAHSGVKNRHDESGASHSNSQSLIHHPSQEFAPWGFHQKFHSSNPGRGSGNHGHHDQQRSFQAGVSGGIVGAGNGSMLSQRSNCDNYASSTSTPLSPRVVKQGAARVGNFEDNNSNGSLATTASRTSRSQGRDHAYQPLQSRDFASVRFTHSGYNGSSAGNVSSDIRTGSSNEVLYRNPLDYDSDFPVSRDATTGYSDFLSSEPLTYAIGYEDRSSIDNSRRFDSVFGEPEVEDPVAKLLRVIERHEIGDILEKHRITKQRMEAGEIEDPVSYRERMMNGGRLMTMPDILSEFHHNFNRLMVLGEANLNRRIERKQSDLEEELRDKFPINSQLRSPRSVLHNSISNILNGLTGSELNLVGRNIKKKRDEEPIELEEEIFAEDGDQLGEEFNDDDIEGVSESTKVYVDPLNQLRGVDQKEASDQPEMIGTYNLEDVGPQRLAKENIYYDLLSEIWNALVPHLANLLTNPQRVLIQNSQLSRTPIIGRKGVSPDHINSSSGRNTAHRSQGSMITTSSMALIQHKPYPTTATTLDSKRSRRKPKTSIHHNSSRSQSFSPFSHMYDSANRESRRPHSILKSKPNLKLSAYSRKVNFMDASPQYSLSRQSHTSCRSNIKSHRIGLDASLTHDESMGSGKLTASPMLRNSRMKKTKDIRKVKLPPIFDETDHLQGRAFKGLRKDLTGPNNGLPPLNMYSPVTVNKYQVATAGTAGNVSMFSAEGGGTQITGSQLSSSQDVTIAGSSNASLMVGGAGSISRKQGALIVERIAAGENTHADHRIFAQKMTQ